MLRSYSELLITPRCHTRCDDSSHLLTLEAVDHESVTLSALGWSPQFPESMGLRCAGEESIPELLLGCAIFCRNSIKA